LIYGLTNYTNKGVRIKLHPLFYTELSEGFKSFTFEKTKHYMDLILNHKLSNQASYVETLAALLDATTFRENVTENDHLKKRLKL
jgi:hypothetical protein